MKGKKNKTNKHRKPPKRLDIRKKILASEERLDVAMEVVKNVPVDARGLTKRDALFVTNVLKGMSKTEAMMLAGEAIGVQLSPAAANLAANKSIGKPEVDSAIVSAFEEAGITDILVAEKMREGLESTAFTQNGQEHTDYKTRLGYLQTVLKVKGQMGGEIENRNQSINYVSFKDKGEDE